MSSDTGQGDLFDSSKGDHFGNPTHPPLAIRMRPRTLKEVIGQRHILGKDCLLPRLIRNDRFGSLIFQGPPGSGKTSLAEVIATETAARFVRINAVLSNVAELRDVLRLAHSEPDGRMVVFIDEIHRFNKSQQDLLLPDVEAGNIRLVGATTHNPIFYVNAPLLSRSHLFRFEAIDSAGVIEVLSRALEDVERGLGSNRCTVDGSVLQALADFSDGDLRRALNALETLVLSQPIESHIKMDAMKVFGKERRIRYDRNEDEYYDHISAMIKSIRGSDPDAALYWAFKMLEGGEDPRLIARRLTIFSSEDIGLANSHALTVAVAAFEACERVGLPECEYNLAHAIIYLATSPKSHSVTGAISAVKKNLSVQPVQPVPLWLRDPRTKKGLGAGPDYLYSHDYPEGVSGQDYLLKAEAFYRPGQAGREAAIAQRMARLKRLRLEIQARKSFDGGGVSDIQTDSSSRSDASS